MYYISKGEYNILKIKNPDSIMSIINKVSVKNMESSRGNTIANQFIVETADGIYFQSYASVIAFKPFGSDKIILDSNKWDYSTTTGKYRNIFLRETKAEILKKIKDGTYQLADLN